MCIRDSLPGAAAQIHAVLPAPGGAVVAGGEDLVVADDDGSVFAPQAGGALQHALGDIQIVVFLVNPVHCLSLLCRFGAAGQPWLIFVYYRGKYAGRQGKIAEAGGRGMWSGEDGKRQINRPTAGMLGGIYTKFTFVSLTKHHFRIKIHGEK